MKQVTSQSTYPYTFAKYDDGSVDYKCKQCGVRVEKTPEQAAKFTQNETWTSTFDFLCTACWKKSQEEERVNPQRIGQAINLAHQHVIAVLGSTFNGTDERYIRTEMLRLARYYYQLASEIQEELSKDTTPASGR